MRSKNSFSNLRLNTNLSLFTNTNIIPYYLFCYHFLNSNNSPTPLLPSSPLDTLFFLTPPLLPTYSLLTPIFSSLNLAQLESFPPFLILFPYYLESSPLSHTSKNSTPTFSLPTFTLPSILCLLFLEHITTFLYFSYFIAMTATSMPAYNNRTGPTFDPCWPWKLWQYFLDLDFYFTWSIVGDIMEYKKHVCCFLNIDTCKL